MGKREFREKMRGGKVAEKLPPRRARVAADEVAELAAMVNRSAAILQDHKVDYGRFKEEVSSTLSNHEERIRRLEREAVATTEATAASAAAPAATATPTSTADVAAPKSLSQQVEEILPPPAKSTVASTAATPAASAAPAAPATTSNPSERVCDYSGVDKVYNGPGYAFKYWLASCRMWGLKTDLWAAKQAGNGVYEPIWVWYKDGKINHILTEDEIKKYAP